MRLASFFVVAALMGSPALAQQTPHDKAGTATEPAGQPAAGTSSDDAKQRWQARHERREHRRMVHLRHRRKH